MPKRVAALLIQELGNRPTETVNKEARLLIYGVMQAGEAMTLLRSVMPGARTKAHQVMVPFARFQALVKEIVAAKGHRPVLTFTASEIKLELLNTEGKKRPTVISITSGTPENRFLVFADLWRELPEAVKAFEGKREVLQALEVLTV